MTIRDLASIRLASQGILEPRYADPLALVKAMGAMQGQDYYGSLWAVGLRTGLTEREVVAALERQEVIRTWPQRGTLHLVPAEDAAWLVALSEERLMRGVARRWERLGIDRPYLERSRKIVADLLRDTDPLSRPAILAGLEAGGQRMGPGVGYHTLWYLSQTGLTYVGPMEGKQQTFGLLSRLVPKPVAMGREEGMAELARRYFTSHGPATLRDFIWWAGLTSAEAKAAVAANDGCLREERVGGTAYWLAKDAQPADLAATAFLLPGFDEYLLGYKDRSAVLAPEHAARVVPGSNGVFLATAVIEGMVVGTWTKTAKKKAVTVAVTPFASLKASEKKLLEEPAEAYARFIGLPLELAFT